MIGIRNHFRASRLKPPVGATINWGHPLACGLVRCYLFNEAASVSGNWRTTNIVDGNSSAYTRNNADTKWQAGLLGQPALRMGAAGVDPAARFPDYESAFQIKDSFSVVAELMPTGSNPFLETTPTVASAAVANRGAGSGIAIGLYNGGAACIVDGSGLAVGAQSSFTTTSGVSYQLAGTWLKDSGIGTYGGTFCSYGGAAHTIARNKASNNYTLAGSFGGTFTANTMQLFCQSSANNTSDKLANYLFIWNGRCLSDQEIAWLAAEPFCFLNYPTSRRSFFVPPPDAAEYDESGSGGLTFGGSASLFLSATRTGSGGIVLGGAATPQATCTPSAAGGVVLSGTAGAQATYSPTPTGSINFGGSTSPQATYSAGASGGVIFSGTGGVGLATSSVAAGGIVFAGTATFGQSWSNTGAGGVVFAGSATAGQEWSDEGTGELVFGGEADVSQSFTYTEEGSGEIVFGGEADVATSTSYTNVGSGEIVFGGSAQISRHFSFIGSGGVILSGTSSPQLEMNPAIVGGLLFSGGAVVAQDHYAAGSGGLLLGGTATVSAAFSLAGSGGVVLGGTATAEIYVVPPPALFVVLIGSDTGHRELIGCSAELSWLAGANNENAVLLDELSELAQIVGLDGGYKVLPQ